MYQINSVYIYIWLRNALDSVYLYKAMYMKYIITLKHISEYEMSKQ